MAKEGSASERAFGAALMKEPARVAHIAAAMQAASPVPVSIKCRIGVDDYDSYAHLQRFVGDVAASGVRHFIIHARKALLKGTPPSLWLHVVSFLYCLLYFLYGDSHTFCAQG